MFCKVKFAIFPLICCDGFSLKDAFKFCSALPDSTRSSTSQKYFKSRVRNAVNFDPRLKRLLVPALKKILDAYKYKPTYIMANQCSSACWLYVE